MKHLNFLRRLFAFLLAAAMLAPAVPAARAAGEVACEKCGSPCAETVLMVANCHSVGVTKYVCSKTECKHSFLVEKDIDPNNHDAICTDNGDGLTHTATCPYHEKYKDVKENHTFEKGRCVKCQAADYSQAVLTLKSNDVDITVDLDDDKATLSIGEVSVLIGNVDITKDYTITYNWYDSKNTVVGNDETYQLPTKVTGKLGDYSYVCFVMATPKNSAAGKPLYTTCTITVHVLDLVSASAIVGSREDDFTLGSINSATTVSVMEQIYDAVYTLSAGYPAYVVFDKAPESTVGTLLVDESRYYFVGNDSQKKLSEISFVPESDGAGSYTISYTAYDNKGKSFPGILTITVERELGELDVAYFAQQGENITLSTSEFELFWQEYYPGGELKQILFLELPTSIEGVFYYNYVAGSKDNKEISDTDVFYVTLSNTKQKLIEGVTFVPAGKFTGQIIIPFNASGLSTRGYYVQKVGELSIFINGGEVEDITYSLTSGNDLTFDGDDFLEVYREATDSKSSTFSIKILDVPSYGDLYIDYTGTKRDIPLTEDTISSYTFYYDSILSREIDDLTYVSEKSSKTVTDTLRYVVCDSKGEFVYMGEIVFTCKSAVVVYTKSFTDVKKGDWFYTYVMDLAEAEIINGFEETVNGKKVYSYRPSNPDPSKTENDHLYQVTYAQALKLIMLAAGYEEQLPITDHWASGYLLKAIEDGLIQESFLEAHLDKQINRNAVAKIVAKAMELPASTRTESPFKDVTMTNTYASYILSLYDAGIIAGSENEDGDYVFNGSSKITRAEMATIVWRIYNYEG